MKTSIDSSVLLSIFNGESEGEAWLEKLIKWRREGSLVICDIVFAEISPAFSSQGLLISALDKLGIAFETMSQESAWLAGTLFKNYRQEKGPREHLIPDFLIAAFSVTQCDRLAAIDRGYYRKYFEKLKVLGL